MHFAAKKIGLIFWVLFLSFRVFSSSWEENALNTAANISYLSDFEKKVIYEINKLRSDPVRYAIEYVEPLKKYYNGRKLFYPDDLPLMTKEGVNALIECIRFLKTQKPVPILNPNQGLTLAANDHSSDQSESGQTGHKGRDQSGFRDRIERYGDWSGRIAENIAYGDISPQQVVIYLLIDDGIPSRGHRKNFLDENFRLVGVSEASHPYYEKMCVMEFAGKFQNLASK
ncbi:MAG: CAP domain-containing protein [Prolixibacteraceae bacterium]|nr:CAP domain-containing protein [Prolixibacteraceae bacterium]MBN2773237.1 CAP domain-containing protein [Prolixibacteraceae bacterium]